MSGSQWWVAHLWQQGQVVELGSWIFWVIFSICLHELGHGFAAIWEGDDTPRRTGHMTWNPMVHMGGFSLIAFLLMGFAWGLMPVNPYNFRHQRWGDAIVAAAGPLVNLILAVLLLTGVGVWDALMVTEANSWQDRVGTFLYMGGWLNLILLAFNLLPAPPLDGSRILASCSSGYARLMMNPQVQSVSLIAVLMIFWMTPIGGMFMDGISAGAKGWAGIVNGLVSSISGQ